ncbi:Calcium-transporting ATPase 2 [Fusarium oxysporum f. sp. albedinis]|nr:Calcium-transporting ATPase 2 [Fusarium oxysporum f. sp. albedinis]
MATIRISMDEELAAFQSCDKDSSRELPDEIKAPIPVNTLSESETTAITQPAPVLIPCKLIRLGKQLQAIEDCRCLQCVERPHKTFFGKSFERLTNSKINWALPGRYICRVVHCRRYGDDSKSLFTLTEHLHTKTHGEVRERL